MSAITRVAELTNQVNKLADVLTSLDLDPVSITVSASRGGGGDVAIQCSTVADVDRLADTWGLDADLVFHPYAGRRPDGFPSNYSRDGRVGPARMSVYTRRPAAPTRTDNETDATP